MNVLAVILPFLCLVVLLEKDNLRESFLTSAVVTGLFIALSTEILSLFASVIDKVNSNSFSLTKSRTS